MSRGKFPDHPWRSLFAAFRMTLKGLIYAPTGALMAAATSSLPETPGGERNYDYRYSWLRDSTFMLWGLYTLGFDREANDFFYFLADLAEGDSDLQIMYGIGGERELTESTLAHLSGYAGPRPSDRQRGLGPAATRCMGCALDSVSLHTRSRERLDERRWPMLKSQVEAALAHWRATGPRAMGGAGAAATLHGSKVLCWVAADRGAKLAELRGEHASATAGAKRPTRSTPMCAPTGPTSEVSSASITIRLRSTHRHFSYRCSGSCRQKTRVCGPRCSPSPTS